MGQVLEGLCDPLRTGNSADPRFLLYSTQASLPLLSSVTSGLPLLKDSTALRLLSAAYSPFLSFDPPICFPAQKLLNFSLKGCILSFVSPMVSAASTQFCLRGMAAAICNM